MQKTKEQRGLPTPTVEHTLTTAGSGGHWSSPWTLPATRGPPGRAQRIASRCRFPAPLQTGAGAGTGPPHPGGQSKGSPGGGWGAGDVPAGCTLHRSRSGGRNHHCCSCSRWVNVLPSAAATAGAATAKEQAGGRGMVQPTIIFLIEHRFSDGRQAWGRHHGNLGTVGRVSGAAADGLPGVHCMLQTAGGVSGWAPPGEGGERLEKTRTKGDEPVPGWCWVCDFFELRCFRGDGPAEGGPLRGLSGPHPVCGPHCHTLEEGKSEGVGQTAFMQSPFKAP